MWSKTPLGVIMFSSMRWPDNKALTCMLLVAATIACIVEPGTASCTNSFFTSLVELIHCRSAVSPYNPIDPTEACCNAIKTVGQPCLCFLMNGPLMSGIDRNMAMQLPGKCAANFEPCHSFPPKQVGAMGK